MAMTLDDYKAQVLADATEQIESEPDYYEADMFDVVFDELMVDDSVTGNGSGSYTFSTAEAADNLSDLMWSDDLRELFKWHGYDHVPLEDGPETVDVIIRCLVLSELYSELEDIWDEASDEWERAAKILIKAGIDPKNSRWLIEWIACGNRIEWAETYAPYIIELWDESDDPEQWARDNPDDHVIIDDSLTCPIVISAIPACY